MLTLPDITRDLAGLIERCIQVRTHGRLRNLRVELSDHAVVLRGVAPTYYTKQLALDGALEAVSSQRIINKIEVH